eukprot:gnl/Spiro4/20923_TR10188_c0_g1_i1.p3 gnl/Spiro4/20923_TR10188_c0_g1~~gnl/Spiro4/20923_TR10188_c0_g1_i1.p3  ORF type:complete len:114 (+),score=6.52 gnl/Spiro4/20923_TR10188_c0_g1_i1:255-596(+)
MSTLVIIRPAKFAMLFTLGSLLTLGSTGFIVGPSTQLRSMFDSGRAHVSVVYLVTMVLTLVVCFTNHSTIVVICLIIVQCVALLWYGLTYIPFGTTMAGSCVRTCCGDPFNVL